MLTLPQLPRHHDCKLCDLHATVKSVGIPTVLVPRSLPPSPSTPALLFIGQNPGYNEDQLGVPFIGKAGNFLSFVYIGDDHPTRGSIGPRLDRICTIYCANTARCGTWSGVEPTDRHYSTCAPYLLPDIAYLHTACSVLFVCCLGGPSVKHFFRLIHRSMSLSSSLDLANTTLQFPSGPIRFFSTYHPAYLIRKQSILPEITDRLSLLRDAILGISPPPSRPTIIPPRSPRP